MDKETTGHLRLPIDRPQLGECAGSAVEIRSALPKDDKNRHLDSGRTEVPIELAPGTHTLQLALGEHLHGPHDPPEVSEVVTITVE